VSRTVTYEQPTSLANAVATLADVNRDATVVAGGTDVLVGARSGKRPFPERIVSIHALGELRYIEADGGQVRIGALTSHSDIERSELMRGRLAALADAAALVGSPATRNLGTIGGNVCNGSPAMDTGGPLIALGAEVQLASATGARSLPVGDFIRGPGEVDLASGELAASFEVRTDAEGPSGSAYVRLGYRNAMEIAIVGATAVVELTGAGAVAHARVCLTAVAPTCIRVPDLEQQLVGVRSIADALTTVDAAQFSEAAPIDDVRASARYRTRVIRVMVRRALERALQRAGAAA
jgi:CO/xanthine dehydrogenase FAD-binding subunit